MPYWFGRPVPDAYLNALKEAYRKGQEDGGHEVEDGDQVILDRMAAAGVVVPRAPSAYDLGRYPELGNKPESDG